MVLNFSLGDVFSPDVDVLPDERLSCVIKSDGENTGMIVFPFVRIQFLPRDCM